MGIIEDLIKNCIWEFSVLSPDPNPETRRQRYIELLLGRIAEKYDIINIATNQMDVVGFYDYLSTRSEWFDKHDAKYFKEISSIMLEKYTVHKKGDFRLVAHSHQIADTGDYDGHYEITDGKISICTKYDEEGDLQPIVDALNSAGCKFYQDDSMEFELKLLKDQMDSIKKEIGDEIVSFYEGDNTAGLQRALEIIESRGKI